VPVKAADFPEILTVRDLDARNEDGIQEGGLMLCQLPIEVAEQRRAYYANKADAQMRAVNENLMRQSDPRMPMHKPVVSSKTTFGSGRG
jgi:hypothetical protein